MNDQPRTGDDDESATPPEVTVPPWLRTGPTPEQTVASAPAVDESAIDTRGAGGERPEAGPHASGGQAVAGPGADGPTASNQAASNPTASNQTAPGPIVPSRITLGLGHRAQAPTAPPVSLAPTASQVRPAQRPDDLSTLPLRSERAGGMPPAVGGAAVAGVSGRGHRARRIGVSVAAGVAVLAGSAVLGFVIARGALAPSGAAAVGCAEVDEPGRVAGNGPGSLDDPAGAVLAFDHAYYVERSAAKAFEAVSPSSRMSEAQLRSEGVDRIPPGTAHCVEARELSPTLLDVTLTESPPEAEPVVYRQRVRVAENPDGTWGIVSITPAG